MYSKFTHLFKNNLIDLLMCVFIIGQKRKPAYIGHMRNIERSFSSLKKRYKYFRKIKNHLVA